MTWAGEYCSSRISAPSQLAIDLLWFAHPALQISILAVMFRRKLQRLFPVFFSYLAAQVVIFFSTYPVYRFGKQDLYFYLYWTGAAISVFLGFKIIHEIFLDVCRPYHTLKDLGTMLFRWAGLVMLLVAIVVAVSSTGAPQTPLVQAILTTQRCVRVIQVGLVMFLLFFSGYLGVSWRQHSFGIAMGLGFYAVVELTGVAMGTSGLISQTTLGVCNLLAYNLSLVIWLVNVNQKSAARELSSNLLRPQRWDESLIDIQHPATPDSLIPMFEGMVERALSRTNGAQHSPAEPAIVAKISSTGS